MLEVRKYKKPELTEMLGTKSVDNLKKKLDRYSVEYDVSGRGEKAIFDIKVINDPFKVFCITELGFDANTNFKRLAYFLYCYFNDEEFMAMPNEVKANRLDRERKYISRQTIAVYTTRLEKKELIYRDTDKFIYYFALGKEQIITNKKEYCQAWKLYWECIEEEAESWMAMNIVRRTYGGCPRKQAIPEVNAFYLEITDYLVGLAQEVIEKDIVNNSNQPINS